MDCASAAAELRRRQFVDLHDVVDAETVGGASQDFRRREGKGEIAGGRQSSWKPEMQEVLLAAGAKDDGAELKGVYTRLLETHL